MPEKGEGVVEMDLKPTNDTSKNGRRVIRLQLPGQPVSYVLIGKKKRSSYNSTLNITAVLSNDKRHFPNLASKQTR